MVTVLLPGEDWLSTNEPSRFSREFKLEALRWMEAGENVSVLARELGVSRKSIINGVIGIGWVAISMARVELRCGKIRRTANSLRRSSRLRRMRLRRCWSGSKSVQTEEGNFAVPRPEGSEGYLMTASNQIFIVVYARAKSLPATAARHGH
jgi:transposase-like protein